MAASRPRCRRVRSRSCRPSSAAPAARISTMPTSPASPRCRRCWWRTRSSSDRPPSRQKRRPLLKGGGLSAFTTKLRRPAGVLARPAAPCLGTAMALLRRAALYIVHLRLPFQLTLAPIFLWGALLSGGRWGGATTAAFVALHLFLYPAATAFNSAYDHDEGPVSGLERPPQVPPGLLGFAIALAAAGAVAAFFAGLGFLLVYTLIVVWTAAYSHPATRWKASPWKSAAAIALGQGALGFAAGWI